MTPSVIQLPRSKRRWLSVVCCRLSVVTLSLCHLVNARLAQPQQKSPPSHRHSGKVFEVDLGGRHTARQELRAQVSHHHGWAAEQNVVSGQVAARGLQVVDADM